MTVFLSATGLVFRGLWTNEPEEKNQSLMNFWLASQSAKGFVCLNQSLMNFWLAASQSAKGLVFRGLDLSLNKPKFDEFIVRR